MNILKLLGEKFAKLAKTLPAIVQMVEQAAKDGKITYAERKDFAMRVVEEVLKEFNIKMGWLISLVISILIDQIARRLPSKDIEIPKFISKVIINFNRE